MLITAIGNSGCKKMIELDNPLNETASSVVFASDKTAKSALSGMYSGLSQSQSQGLNLTLYGSLQSDDLLYISTVAGLQEMMNNSYLAASSLTGDVWAGWYNVIYRANAIILGLQNTAGTTPSVNKQLTAEAKLVRAYCFFNLINIFGNVPLVLQTDVAITAYQPKETTANVYKQIISDLTDAKANLLSDYSFTGGDRLGVNKFVAEALLARVYLYTGDYASAESNASDVIASSLYSIIPKETMATGVFVKNSTESIWQMSAYLVNTNQYTLEGSTFVPTAYTAALLKYQINPNLLSIFPAEAPLDLRRTKWMNDAIISGVSYSVPFKYKYPTNALAVTANVTELQVVLRLAEQYLIRAEARARIGTNITGALSDLNKIHERAGLIASTTTDPTALLAEIALENRKEFFCEQGLRWFNLKRTGQADAVLGALKPTWTAKAKLLPIPQAAIDANYNLTQNPGY